MRNFYVTAQADGLRPVATGPRGRNGGADVSVYVKVNGESVKALDILCRACADGTLAVIVQTPSGNVAHTVRVAA